MTQPELYSVPSEQSRKSSTEPAQTVPPDVFPLSYMQESLWVIERVVPGNSAYNLPEAWRCRGRLDIPALQRSLDALVQRHESLRTIFRVRDDRPVQVIHAPQPFRLSLIDLGDVPVSDDELQSLLEAEARRPFDLARGPLARATVFRLAEEDHAVFLNLHHIIADEWSFNILRRELAELYVSARSGRPLRLPDLPIQYADFAVWQRARMNQPAEHLEFWKRKLSLPLPMLDLPTDFPRPTLQSLQGATRFTSLPRDLSEGLRELSRRESATLYMTLLAGFLALLHRCCRQTDLVVGSPIAGREQAETEGLIGFLVNTHALRVDASGDPSFVEFLRRVREVTLEANRHKEMPLDRILEAIQPPRQPNRHPLFQVVFGLQPSEADGWTLPGMALERIEVDNGGSKFDWTLLATDSNAGLRLRSEYSTDVFESGTLARIVHHFEVLLAAIVAEPNRRLSELPLLNEAEQQQLIAAWNPSPAASQPGQCLHHRFEARADRAPDAIAICDEEERLTYGQLNARANQLAHFLQNVGVGPEVPVALCLERSMDLVVACLGVLKAGGIYVPIDPAVPQERIDFMLQDTGARVLLTQGTIRARFDPMLSAARASSLPPETTSLPSETNPAVALEKANWRNGAATGATGLKSAPAQQPRVICIDSDWDEVAGQPKGNPSSRVRPENGAYIIYTSGSTGRPKGVLVTHFNVVRLFEQTEPWFGFGSADVWTVFHSYTFDFSVWEMWGALLYGGRLVVVPYLISRSPHEFLNLLAREGVTVLNQTPSAFRQLLWAEETRPARPELSLRYVIFGGEALELQSLRPWFERHGDSKPTLVNMYGITETTVHVTYRVIRQADLDNGLASVIGVPIPDLRLYLLDEHLQPVPLGVPGEICVGGAGVARGYLNRPELTAERFVTDPWSSQTEARLYRSGDLARYKSNGELEYLGRADHQVKIRGFRVELGEIESVLNRHPSIRESCVTADEFGGERRLLAYVVPVNDAMAATELREYLAKTLPDYMVPSVFVSLEALPLTNNGKVDRRALPCPARPEATRGKTPAPPRNELEENIAEIWHQVLGHDSIGVHDNFFHLGGHSLLASQVIARLSAIMNIDLSVRLLFEAPTVAGLAEAVGRAQREQPSRAAAIPRRVTPSRAQELLAQLDELTDAQIEELLGQPENHRISA